MGGEYRLKLSGMLGEQVDIWDGGRLVAIGRFPLTKSAYPEPVYEAGCFIVYHWNTDARVHTRIKHTLHKHGFHCTGFAPMVHMEKLAES